MRRLLPLLCALCLPAQQAPLWTLGRPDLRTSAFALGPLGWRDYRADGAWVVDATDPRQDWPYVHPGPDEKWAGSRLHPFRILFTLAATPPSGTAELVVEALDSRAWGPQTLAMSLNGARMRTLPVAPGTPGAGPVDGKFEKVSPQTLRFAFPTEALRKGLNEVVLTMEQGGWLLYDTVSLRAPGAALAPTLTTRLLELQAPRALREHTGRSLQPIRLRLLHTGPEAKVPILVDGQEVSRPTLRPGIQEVEVFVPAVDRARPALVAVGAHHQEVPLKPVPRLTVFVVPHSHTDIGYTHLQPEVEARQVANLEKGMAEAARTATYPEGARFVWNVEVSWAADLFLQRKDAAACAAFDQAVKRGQVALHGFYLNTLTGLSRPEELVQTFRHAAALGHRLGVPVDTAMISDIPGHTWGVVPAMAQAGLRYLSTSPNFFDRIGTAQLASADQPFWWLGPDGSTRILVWNTFQGYALSHGWAGQLNAQRITELVDRLESVGYPYDLTHIRWSGQGDNAEPDVRLADIVRDWNERYAWPRLVLSDQRTPFLALEQKYGAQLPVRSGDWTPYWEDGAYSTARETVANRQSADRLAVAQVLWALRAPERWPAAQAQEAWKQVLRFTEHTWGAWNSISEPHLPFVLQQWEIKAGYAQEADRATRALLEALPGGAKAQHTVDVVNPSSWTRTEVIRIGAALSQKGDRVVDTAGQPLPSQRLASGELAVLVTGLPPFATRRLRIQAGVSARPPQPVRLEANLLASPALQATIDATTGALADVSDPRGRWSGPLGGYRYFLGADPTPSGAEGATRLEALDRGPLVATLRTVSEAPGVRSLVREYRLESGADHLALQVTVDKTAAPGPDYMAPGGKESLSLIFPLPIPGGQVRYALPLAGAVRPDADQIPGSNKHWFSVGNWADVSAPGRGFTLATPDAALLQVGGLTATMLGSQTDPKAWRNAVGPTQTLAPWLMNNHWGTNYKAFQEGPVTFRFGLRPHGGFDPLAATRFGDGLAQPLVVLPAVGPNPSGQARIVLSSPEAVVAALKPADDGKGLVLRLTNPTQRDTVVSLGWASPKPRTLWRSDTLERRIERLDGAVPLPAGGLLTLRADF